MVVVPDEQAHTDESEQELEGYDENVYHIYLFSENSMKRGSVVSRQAAP